MDQVFGTNEAPEVGSELEQGTQGVQPATSQGQTGAPTATSQGQTEPSAQATQTQTEQAPQQTTAANPDEKLFAGRYKSVEDLEKGYLELRRYLSQRDAAMEALRQAQSSQTTAQPPQPQTQTVDWSAASESFRQAFEQDPLGTVMRLAQYVVSQQVRPLHEQSVGQALVNQAMQLALEYPDFSDLSPKVGELIKSRPYLQQVLQQNPKALEDVYLMARASLANEAVQAAKEAGRQEAQAVLQAKQGAQTEGTSARKATAQKSAEELLTEAIFGSGESGGIFG